MCLENLRTDQEGGQNGRSKGSEREKVGKVREVMENTSHAEPFRYFRYVDCYSEF